MAVRRILSLALLLLPTTTLVIDNDSKCDDAENKMIFIVSPDQENFANNGDYFDEIKKAYDKFGLVLVQGLMDNEIIVRTTTFLFLLSY